MLSKGTEFLDEILENQPPPRKAKATIGFNYQNVNKIKEYNQDTKYMHVPLIETIPTMYGIVHPHLSEHPPSRKQTRPKPKYRGKFRSWICHHCGRKGHIRPFCFKLYGYPDRSYQPKSKPLVKNTKKEWKPKDEDVKGDVVKVKEDNPKCNNGCLIAHTSLKVSSREDCYFDSGCSRHMTGIERYLTDVESYATNFVTFGDGAKGEIKGIGKLIDNGLPKLDSVLLVKGLTANLISISQLCDQGMKVNFSKFECLITNDKDEVLMKGVRSKDNCYLWAPIKTTYSSTCLKTNVMMESINVMIDDSAIDKEFISPIFESTMGAYFSLMLFHEASCVYFRCCIASDTTYLSWK
ncbi:gag-pol polyprotein [Trifolium pratense]|uniref:Gag-pol polyprotein n=1 Tax=Trifolium pratense TaxID=57577 RepID=A0A2K3MFF5_TRIPR|nr:gag-pol polyprotein [Trifolium pratense]